MRPDSVCSNFFISYYLENDGQLNLVHKNQWQVNSYIEMWKQKEKHLDLFSVLFVLYVRVSVCVIEGFSIGYLLFINKIKKGNQKDDGDMNENLILHLQ